MTAVEYVVPLRWSTDDELDEFTDYLQQVSTVADVTVVDGSEPPLYEHHARVWGGFARTLRPLDWPGRNRKVAGVVTGVFSARHDRVIIADDDVRYRACEITAVQELLDDADLVRPQNYFDPLPWHATLDSGRIVLNRFTGADFPGTFGIRRATFQRMNGYDGDVLFENLQMIRTVKAAGGTEKVASGLYVRRRPPTLPTFLNQRIRQAYDDFGQPLRLALEASWLPALILAARRPALLGALSAGVIVAAEVGRRRAGGARYFPVAASLCAPLWVAERAVCVWLAAVAKARGGAVYRDQRIPHATRPVQLRDGAVG